jgi:hypothetical protein
MQPRKNDKVWETLSTFWSDDRSKKANVNVDKARCCYFVDYFEEESCLTTIAYPGKSLRWAEDCAENYTLGILHV